MFTIFSPCVLPKEACRFAAGQQAVHAAGGPGLRMNQRDKLSGSINASLALHTS